MRSIVIKAGFDCSIRIMVSRTIIGNIRFSVPDLRVGQHVSSVEVVHASSEDVLVETICTAVAVCLEESLLVLVQRKDIVNRCSNVCGYLRCGDSAKRTLYCVIGAHLVASCRLCGIGIIVEHMVAFISEEFHGISRISSLVVSHGFQGGN